MARPQIIAHRGASETAPENTLAAFRQAVALGVDAVELDVHLSADSVPVVIHDPVLGRTTEGSGLVKDQTWTTLRGVDAGRWFDERFAGERVPSLAEALDILRPVGVIVEIKNGPIYYPDIAARVVEVIKASGHPAVTVSSFDHKVLPEITARAPEVETAVLFSARPIDPVRLARDAGARRLHPHWAFATQDMLDAAHSAGLWVDTWTVDDAADMARLAAAGVDGIITNLPDRLRATLAAHGDGPRAGAIEG